jgi:SAM-dependent methyltransferase
VTTAAGCGRRTLLDVVVRGRDAVITADRLREGVPGCPGSVQVRALPGQERTNGDVVIDARDGDWPVVRHVAPDLPWSSREQIDETRAFFGVRARNWDTKFGDDLPAYARAVAEAQIPPGAVVADVGCGTGRGTPALRSAVGFRGRVLALDVTREMLDTLRDAGRGDGVHLVMADAQRLPLGTGALDGVFAAGLVPHLRYPEQGLRELARVTRAEGCLILFHPSGRRALACRHGTEISGDDVMNRPVLADLLGGTGWRLVDYDDAEHRFFALALRAAVSA